MNIFENYLKKIKDLIKKNQKKLELKNIDNLKGINLEIPPSNINSDLSSNICMILAKVNKLNPNKYFKEMLNICTKEKLEDISMGMSSDYKEAIINGANNIRIGSLLFGEREKNNYPAAHDDESEALFVLQSLYNSKSVFQDTSHR